MKRSSTRRGQVKRSTKRLSLQQLETRKLMAADIGLADGVLSLQGTEMDDVAEVYSESGELMVRLTSYDSQGQLTSEVNETFAADDVQRVVFVGGDGNDVLVNDTSVPTIARSGAGADVLMGGDGDDLMAGGTGDDVILGGGGNDLILGGPGANIIVEPLVNDSADNSDADDGPASDPAAVADSGDTVTVNEEPSDVAVDEPVADDVPTDAVLTNVVVEGDLVEDQPDNVCMPEPTVEETVEEAVEEAVGEAVEEAVEEAAAVNDEIAGVEPLIDATPVEETAVTEVEVTDPVELHVTVIDQPTDESAETEVVVCEETAPVSEDLAPPVADTPPVDVAPPVEVAPAADIVATVDATPMSEDETVVETEEPAEISADAENQVDIEVTPEAVDPVDAAEADEETSESDDDVIFGGAGDDWIFGGDGNDLLFGNMSPLDDALLRQVIAGRFGL